MQNKVWQRWTYICHWYSSSDNPFLLIELQLKKYLNMMRGLGYNLSRYEFKSGRPSFNPFLLRVSCKNVEIPVNQFILNHNNFQRHVISNISRSFKQINDFSEICSFSKNIYVPLFRRTRIIYWNTKTKKRLCFPTRLKMTAHWNCRRHQLWTWGVQIPQETRETDSFLTCTTW
jgi:hypothetical protein